MNAVGANEHVAVSGGTMRAVPIEEIGDHAAVVLGKSAKPMAGMNARLAQSRAHSLKDHALQAAAMNGELRVFIAGIGAARLAPDLLREAICIDELIGADADGVEARQQSKLRELLDRMRECIDSNPKLANGFALLVKLAVDPARMQHQGGGQAANAA